MKKILPFLIIIFLLGMSNGLCSEPIGTNDLLLNIDSSEVIVETKEFTVTIMANETPVDDVTVFFKASKWRFKDSISIETTNSFGQVQFTAPSIIHSRYNKTYTIYATKVGYITNEKNITILNIPNLLIKEEIRSDYKRDERVTFTVIDNSSKPIANATIKFNDSTYYSDEKGKVTITMPSDNGQYSLKITKDGYAPYLDDIKVMDPYLDYSIMIGFLCAVFGCIAFISIVIIIILLLYRDRERIM